MPRKPHGPDQRRGRPEPQTMHRPSDSGQQGRRDAEPPGPRHRSPKHADPNLVLIWGYHPVREALRSPRRKPVRLSATAAAAERLAPETAARGISPAIVSAEELAARLPRDAVHQGVLLEARPISPLAIDDLPTEGLVIVLDQVTDPHNVGAILRTAAAYGAVGLVTTERHAPAMTGVVAKAASGGLEHVPVVPVVNLARGLEHLGDLGFLRIGLDSDGAVPLGSVPRAEAVALVLGAEGQGLRRLTRENCDVIAKLDVPGPIKSLNVSNACAAAVTVLHLRRSVEGPG